jgi:hypothetical protein
MAAECANAVRANKKSKKAFAATEQEQEGDKRHAAFGEPKVEGTTAVVKWVGSPQESFDASIAALSQGYSQQTELTEGTGPNVSRSGTMGSEDANARESFAPEREILSGGKSDEEEGGDAEEQPDNSEDEEVGRESELSSGGESEGSAQSEGERESAVHGLSARAAGGKRRAAYSSSQKATKSSLKPAVSASAASATNTKAPKSSRGGGEASDTSRERRITIVYVVVLVLMLGALAALVSSVVVALESTSVFAADINAVGRRQYTAARAMLLAQELASFERPSSSFAGGALPELSNLTNVVCHLRTTAQYLLMIHTGLVKGGAAGFEYLPHARKWPTPSALDECSPLVDDPVLFPTVIPEEVHGAPGDSKILFEGACMTDLSVLVLHPEALEEAEWAGEWAKSFHADECKGFRSGDPLFTFGLHRIVENFAGYALEAADVAGNWPVIRELLRAMEVYYIDSKDFTEGMLMSMMFYLEETYVATAFAKTIVGIMFGVTLIVLVFQYAFLGNRVEKLLKENAFIAMNIQVLLEGMRDMESEKDGSTRIQKKM